MDENQKKLYRVLPPNFEALFKYLQEGYSSYQPSRQAALFHARFPDGVRINQYDDTDCLCNTFESYSGVLACPNYSEYYYRYDAFPDTMREKLRFKHFGLSLYKAGLPFLSEDQYCNDFLNDTIKSRRIHAFCGAKNLDPFLLPVYDRYLGKMKQIVNLDYQEFESALGRLTEQYQLEEVLDLNECNGCSGIYLLVLEMYKQLYIGQSTNIKARIINHWNRKDLVSGCCIDTFRAKDTKRIFVMKDRDGRFRNHHNDIEIKMIGSVDPKFLLNIMPGGDWIGDIHDPDGIVYMVE